MDGELHNAWFYEQTLSLTFFKKTLIAFLFVTLLVGSLS